MDFGDQASLTLFHILLFAEWMCDGNRRQSTASMWQTHPQLDDQDENPVLRLMSNFTLNNLLMQLFIHTCRWCSTHLFFLWKKTKREICHIKQEKCEIFSLFFKSGVWSWLLLLKDEPQHCGFSEVDLWINWHWASFTFVRFVQVSGSAAL